MRKRFKSLLSMILSAAMVVSLGAGTVTGSKASAEEAAATDLGSSFTAYLVQNNSHVWTAGNDAIVEDEEGNVLVDGGFVASSGAITTTGEFYVEAEAEDDVDNMLTDGSYIGVEFGNLGKGTREDGKTVYRLSNLSFTIKAKSIIVTHNGTPKEYDWSKAVLYNNSQKETNPFRFGVVNQYAGDDEWTLGNPFSTPKDDLGNWSVSDTIPVAMGDMVRFTFEVTPEAPTIAPTPTPTAEPTAPPASAAYNAYLGFQTNISYVFRNACNDKEYGVKGSKMSGKYSTHITQGETTYPAKIADAKVEKNDTEYKVSISNIDLTTIKAADGDPATAFSMLYVTTDIPLAMKGVTAQCTSLKINGQEIKKGFAMPNKPDASGTYQFMVADAYSDDDGIKNVAYPKDEKSTVSHTSTLNTLPKGATGSMEIAFTLKGADFSGSTDYNTKVIGVKKNKTFTSGNFKYKVTKAATITAGKKAEGKVSIVGLSTKGKKAKKLTVGTKVSKTVSKVKATYKITALGKGAFKGAKKLTAVTLSKNIKKIPKNAFQNCKKLNKLTLKAKLSSVAKGSFKGCKKTITVKGSKKIKTASLKKLKKSGYKKFK